MIYLSRKLQELLSGLKIRKQLNIIYALAFFIPMACIGVFLVLNTSRLLSTYHQDLNEANNFRVKTILTEITTQIYTLSEDIIYDDSIQDLLTVKYRNQKEFAGSATKYEDINNYLSIYSEVKDIVVYSDNPTIKDYEHFKKVNGKITSTNWYKKAIKQSSAFWANIQDEDRYGNTYYNLCLIRQIYLLDKGINAVIVIKIDENYLKSQLESNDYELLLYVDYGGMFFCSNRLWYDYQEMIDIDYSKKYYQYEGEKLINEEKYMVTVSTLNPLQTDNSIYVCNMDNSVYDNISQILSLCLLIVVAATVIPFLLMRYFSIHFSGRVETLREAMHKASNENYDVPAKLLGEDEISQAFYDLQKMVAKIKDKDARMYEAKLNTQSLQNAQQRIEMNVLASQINPHFLYNTLETIRMKAFKAGDRDVATAIKLLGKSMRYVLENTGTSSTTLKNELDYIDTYLQIQKLRFENKVNYTFVIEEGLKTEEIDILPLLIQPIVENAIVHGLEEVEDNGQIKIEVYTIDIEMLRIDISDNGSGMSQKTLNALREKINTSHLNPSRNIGIYNINQRIHLCYGLEYGITINSVMGEGTKVSLSLPLKINGEVN